MISNQSWEATESTATETITATWGTDTLHVHDVTTLTIHPCDNDVSELERFKPNNNKPYYRQTKGRRRSY